MLSRCHWSRPWCCEQVCNIRPRSGASKGGGGKRPSPASSNCTERGFATAPNSTCYPPATRSPRPLPAIPQAAHPKGSLGKSPCPASQQMLHTTERVRRPATRPGRAQAHSRLRVGAVMAGSRGDHRGGSTVGQATGAQGDQHCADCRPPSPQAVARLAKLARLTVPICQGHFPLRRCRPPQHLSFRPAAAQSPSPPTRSSMPPPAHSATTPPRCWPGWC